MPQNELNKIQYIFFCQQMEGKRIMALQLFYVNVTSHPSLLPRPAQPTHVHTVYINTNPPLPLTLYFSPTPPTPHTCTLNMFTPHTTDHYHPSPSSLPSVSSTPSLHIIYINIAPHMKLTWAFISAKKVIFLVNILVVPNTPIYRSILTHFSPFYQPKMSIHGVQTPRFQRSLHYLTYLIN